jgi:hypothetical protein
MDIPGRGRRGRIDHRIDVIAIDARILEIVVIEPIQFVDRGDPEYLILAPARDLVENTAHTG